MYAKVPKGTAGWSTRPGAVKTKYRAGDYLEDNLAATHTVGSKHEQLHTGLMQRCINVAPVGTVSHLTLSLFSNAPTRQSSRPASVADAHDSFVQALDSLRVANEITTIPNALF
jgi:hypothetical protein